jgi:hypothetical protein
MKENGRMMFLLDGGVTSGSRERWILRLSRLFTKDSGKQAKEMDMEHSFIIMAAD